MDKMIDWTWGDINNGDVGPGMFSWFHFLWLGIMIVACVVMGLTVARKHSGKADRITVSVFSVILIGCEVFKQLFWFAYYDYYRFEIFPFQFCSVPIYVAIAAAVMPWDKAREICYRFLPSTASSGASRSWGCPRRCSTPTSSPYLSTPCSGILSWWSWACTSLSPAATASA